MTEYTDNYCRGSAPVPALNSRAIAGGLPLQVFCLREISLAFSDRLFSELWYKLDIKWQH
jgi:hypothetical protein